MSAAGKALSAGSKEALAKALPLSLSVGETEKKKHVSSW
jgi:hypothetical protein